MFPVSTIIILSFLSFLPSPGACRPRSIPLSFSLAHEYRLPHLDRAGTEQILFDDTSARPSAPLALRAVPTTIYRPRSAEAIQHARWRSMRHAQSEEVQWDQVKVLGPDVGDRHTISQLARMTGNAYALPGQKNWYDIDEAWNVSFPFGWGESEGGPRGHVFVSSDNSTVILSIKGTTVQGATSKIDKYNDNLLFSCCCARVDFSWVFSTVCDCYSRHWRCDNTCLSEALIQDSLFYSVGVNLVSNLTTLFPHSNIWLVGHSLGGALASLLGTTFGFPAIAFESPGESLAAHRLHLPLPPRSPTSNAPSAPITHVYHNADPIPQGVCTGFGSPCASAGYALETRCHLGKKIVYDTVNKLGWRVDVRKHIIREVIMNILELDREWEEGRDVPLAVEEDEDCVDCWKWEFGDFKDN